MPTLLVGNEATGQWMRNSALDNAGFLARDDWRLVEQLADARAPSR